MNHWISLFALSALALAGPAGAEVFKCRSADGHVEFANRPCAKGTDTLKSVTEEKISEASRLQAEREVERMRDYVEQREAAQRAELMAERERRASQGPMPEASGTSTPPGVDECLREVDRQALPAVQRAQMESACRSAPPPVQPVYVPVALPGYGGRGVPHRPLPPKPAPTPAQSAPGIVLPCLPGARNCRQP